MWLRSQRPWFPIDPGIADGQQIRGDHALSTLRALAQGIKATGNLNPPHRFESKPGLQTNCL
jgi:hypothetical protein